MMCRGKRQNVHISKHICFPRLAFLAVKFRIQHLQHSNPSEYSAGVSEWKATWRITKLLNSEPVLFCLLSCLEFYEHAFKLHIIAEKTLDESLFFVDCKEAVFFRKSKLSLSSHFEAFEYEQKGPQTRRVYRRKKILLFHLDFLESFFQSTRSIYSLWRDTFLPS